MPLPADSALPNALPHIDHSDTYTIPLPPDAPSNPQHWADELFAHPPLITRILMGARKRFPELSRSENEIVLGANDLHLDFRIGIHVNTTTRLITVRLTTRAHNEFGKFYFQPVHRLIVRLAAKT